MIWFGLYVGAILLANVMVLTLGLVPVGFGLVAPAGVYMAGLALVLRDILQERMGRRAVLGAIVVGALLSAGLSGPLALASGIAFAVSELTDWSVYEPFRRRRWLLAVLLSGLVGLVVDSVLFLQLAFGSLDFLAGQVVGKATMTLAAVAVLWWARQRGMLVAAR